MLFMYGIAVCPVGLAWLKRMKKLRAIVRDRRPAERG
jgi:hypothetical protein